MQFSSPELTCYFNQCRKSGIPLHAIFSEHQAIKTAHLSYSNFHGSQFLNESNTKLLACITTPLIFVTHCTFTALPAVLVFIRLIHVQNPTPQRKTAGFRSFSQGIRHSATLSSDKVAVGASKTSSSDTWWHLVALRISRPWWGLESPLQLLNSLQNQRCVFKHDSQFEACFLAWKVLKGPN